MSLTRYELFIDRGGLQASTEIVSRKAYLSSSDPNTCLAVTKTHPLKGVMWRIVKVERTEIMRGCGNDCVVGRTG